MNKRIVKIIVSIIYIIWGISSPLTAWNALLALDLGALLAAAVGVLTLLAGICGVLGLFKSRQRLFGIIIFVVSVVGIAAAWPVINLRSVINAVLALLFVLC